MAEEAPNDYGSMLVERHFQDLSDALKRRDLYDAWLRSTPEGVPETIAAWWLTAEVENGGFGQYFDNSYGGMIDEAIHGLELSGQVELANAARLAKRQFGETVPFDQDERMNAVEAISTGDTDPFAAAEAVYYSVPWGFCRERANDFARALFDRTASRN